MPFPGRSLEFTKRKLRDDYPGVVMNAWKVTLRMIKIARQGVQIFWCSPGMSWDARWKHHDDPLWAVLAEAYDAFGQGTIVYRTIS